MVEKKFLITNNPQPGLMTYHCRNVVGERQMIVNRVGRSSCRHLNHHEHVPEAGLTTQLGKMKEVPQCKVFLRGSCATSR